MKKLAFLLSFICCAYSVFAGKKTEPVVVAYVTSWTKVVPDPTVMTHINYAFGHVNDQFNGVRIDNEQRLRDIVALKKQQPKLLVMLSIGGWGSGRFSEMAASDENRKAFVRDCRRVCNELGLDGIDIDWEYPTQKSAGISASPQDTENFTLLMRDLRQALGSKLWLTLASVGSAQYIDFRSCVQYLDMVNVMAYDMGNAPNHHSALYRSKIVGWLCASECVQAHRKAGVPDDKIVLGMPFYGRGKSGVYMKYRDRDKQTLKEVWHNASKASYLIDENSELAIGFESPRSIAMKCAYLKEQGLRGAMYWEYADDNEQGDLQRAVWQGVLQNDKDRSKATQKAAKRLAAVLKENEKREDITPDSFFYDWRQLKAEMLAEKDPTAQAIYRAVMARLLVGNSWRSQRYDSHTKSDPDSIQEWTYDEYRRHSAELYAQALQDAEALHAVKLPDTKPLTMQGKDDGIFGNDVLSFVWQDCLSNLTEEERRDNLVPRYEDIINVYQRHGLREATLMLRLDSLSERGNSESVLTKLRDEYGDLDACAEVYLRLSNLYGKTNQEKEDLLNFALKRYPKSREANAIRNRIAELRQPELYGRFPDMCYPGKVYDIPLEIKNMQSASITVYRMPYGFVLSDEETAAPKHEQVKQSGTLFETLPVSMEGVEALETKKDTLHWRSPGFGCYAFVFDGTSTEKLKKYEPRVVLFDVSALTYMNITLPDGKERIMVTDMNSGEPQQGVKVVFYNKPQQEYTKLEELTTDSRGIAEANFDANKGNLYIELSRGEDKALRMQSLGWRSRYSKDDALHHRINIYTDRSIYRPGQTVYVGGFAYCWQHGETPEAEERTDLQLTVIDANGQEIIKHTLKTDEFGSLTDSLQLPKTGLPGSYHIRLDGWLHYFRVEEYRRPTFQVEMDEAPAISLPVDSITLTGRALTYSQWPVSNARVTGTYRWQQSWWYRHFEMSRPNDIDTLYTDDEGRFSIRIPVSKELSKEDLRWGRILQLSVDVLSPEGETQQGSIRVPICSTPLRLWGNVPSQQCRERLLPLCFNLYSSNDKEVEGNVLCMLTQNGKEIKNFFLPANKDTIPEVLRTLPSGKYDIVAKAGGQWSKVEGQWSESDTASFKASFTIFSITDKRLLGKHDLWLYTPCDTISAEKPARFQIGTTLPDAWIYCIINGENGIVRDTLLHLSDQAMLMEVPYEESFQHHLAVSTMLMHEGEFEQKKLHFRFEQPETQLAMRWDTFRDQLQPGQKEQWRLTLTRPDGTPASANVMVGMYDASLDALSSYEMRSGISLFTQCDRDMFFRVGYFGWYGRYRYASLNLPLQFLPTENYYFSHWNIEYFEPLRMTRSERMLVRGVREKNRIYEVMEAPIPSIEFQSVDARLQRKVAELDVVQNSKDLGDNATRLRGLNAPAREYAGAVMAEEAADAEAGAIDDAYVRSNLSELAFFYPQLRTDSKGQTSIEFTLPEGLTSWHLHGLAHTKDMMTAEWEETIVAKKELMAELTLPRFVRNGDEVTLTASIRNASEKRQKGEAVLKVIDAEGNKSIKQMKVTFDIEPGKEAIYHMPLTATLDHPVLAVQWVAKGKGSSDGEVRYLPVLSDMQHMTETKTYLLKGDTTLTMDLSKLFANGNPKARNKTLTVEHVSEPVTLALQALPSLTAPVHNDVLSVATAYYAGSVAYHLAHKYEGLRTVISRWADEEDSPALQSPLVKNQQLSDILLNETPWMIEAQQQKASRHRIASLFAEMEQEQRRMAMLSALSTRQHADGSFGWFPGMSGSVWMTTEVAMLLSRLGDIKDVLSVPERQILDKALSFLEKDMHQDVEALRKEKKPILSFYQLRYLYIYIMYKKRPNEDAKYLLSLLKKQAEDYDREERALAAIVLKRTGEDKKAQALMPRIHELLRHSDGMYIAYPSGSFVSIDRKVEAHANFMEAVFTVEPGEKELLAKMAEWLILQKRSQEWDQPIQSADAIYALLQSDFHTESGQWSGKVTYDNQTRKLQKPEVDYGYIREQIEDIGKAKALTIEQKYKANGFSWGTVYAQCQLPAAEVENNREGMTIRREVSSENRNGSMANGQWRTGDRVHVRYTITADRDYEYVCLKAPRPAATEPVRQLSGYHWQGGLGYYQAMHDASTEYFMDRMPRGTYVIEEDWLISRDGNYLLPPARLTCLYAPEYQSQTAGEKFKVK
jgi:GH18 family chitinase